MEPLFTLKHENTEAEFIRFNRTVAFKFRHMKVALITVNIVLLLFVAVAIMNIVRPYSDTDVVVYVFIGIGLYLDYAYLFGINRQARKLYRQNKAVQGLVTEYTFYADHFETRDPSGTGTLPYDKLYKVIETPTHFYLMISKIQGFTVSKEGAPEGFISFMQQMMNDHNLKA